MMDKSSTYLLLALALMLFTGGNSQCRENDIANFELSQHCSIIHDALEAALVRTDNLYRLRTAFYPSSHVAPALLMVQYNIVRANNVTMTVLLGWTESGVFAAINPHTLYSLQLRALYHPLKELVLEPRMITLSLDVENSAELTDVLDSEIEDVLNILNSRVSLSIVLVK